MRLNVTNQPELKTFRTRLRKNLTPAEAKLWKTLQGSKLDGRKFRRQQSIGKYVLDFYCPQEKLAVELDGEAHFNELAIIRDRERSAFIQYFGIKVIRFENRIVFENLEWVMNKIRSNFGWRTTDGQASDERADPKSAQPRS
jgi:very-short-patch-repair endonuclease